MKDRDTLLELVSEIREDVKEVRTDLKTLMTKTHSNERDLTWIKGGLSVAFACILSIAGYLLKLALDVIIK